MCNNGYVEGQRPIYLSKTCSIGDHYHYQSDQYKNVLKCTLLNECNVTTQEYNLTTDFLSSLFHSGVSGN